MKLINLKKDNTFKKKVPNDLLKYLILDRDSVLLIRNSNVSFIVSTLSQPMLYTFLPFLINYLSIALKRSKAETN